VLLVPAGHSKQIVAPVDGWYCPALQGMQKVEEGAAGSTP
jgi:hypothetical protein